jgi:hypothetical protein
LNLSAASSYFLSINDCDARRRLFNGLSISTCPSKRQVVYLERHLLGATHSVLITIVKNAAIHSFILICQKHYKWLTIASMMPIIKTIQTIVSGLSPEFDARFSAIDNCLFLHLDKNMPYSFIREIRIGRNQYCPGRERPFR